MKNYYGDRIEVCMTDTDSLICDIKTHDVYDDMKQFKDLFDFSNYLIGHSLRDTINEKVVGKMKDECSGKVIHEFIGLRSKMYSLFDGEQEKKTAKGVSKPVIKHMLRHELYFDCLVNSVQMKSKMNLFRSVKHEILGITLNKISLSPYDDKRYVLSNGKDTLAHGHMDIRKLAHMYF